MNPTTLQVSDAKFEEVRAQLRKLMVKANFTLADVKNLYELGLVEIELEMNEGNRSKAGKAIIESGYRIARILRNEARGIITPGKPQGLVALARMKLGKWWRGARSPEVAYAHLITAEAVEPEPTHKAKILRIGSKIALPKDRTKP